MHCILRFFFTLGEEKGRILIISVIKTFSLAVFSIDTTAANEGNSSNLEVKILISKTYEEKNFQMFIPSINKSHALAKSYLDVLLAPLKANAKFPLASKQKEYYQNVPQEGDSLEVQVY